MAIFLSNKLGERERDKERESKNRVRFFFIFLFFGFCDRKIGINVLIKESNEK